jgi:DNA-3-methyladenine glycosylase I
VRCFGNGDPLYERYHDEEWGRPQQTEQALYERICLEGFQAGLAWITVLRKREALREAFAGFDPDAVAAYDGIEHLLEDARLIRSRAKLTACVTNARATVALRDAGGLVELVWQAGQLPSPAYDAWADVPGSTAASLALAKQLKRAGFTFVGPTTVYATLQACGVVNDHLSGCPVRPAVEGERISAARPSGTAGRA